MTIIGLSGTNGSGKDSVGQLLSEKHGFLFISVTDLLREEAARRGQDHQREILRTISTEWRRQFGLGVLVDKAIELYNNQGGDEVFHGLVIASLRNPGEAERIHQLNGFVVWVDADPKIRYDRIYSRQRSPEDDKTFQEFMREEEAEMTHSGDEATLSMENVKKASDIVLINEGTSLVELESEINRTLGNRL